MTTHTNATILRLIADGHPVQWRVVESDTWKDFVPGNRIGGPNPLVPDARVIWREKPAEATIAGIIVPAPLPVHAHLAPLRTYYVAGLDSVRSATGDSTQAEEALEARTLHSTVEAARLHSTALRRLNESFFR